MTNYQWENTFSELFFKSVERYRSGDTDYLVYFNEEELNFLSGIGCKRREIFDFVEDFCDEGIPTPESALLTAAVRRDYFTTIQNGVHSINEVKADELPGKDELLEGIRWLPRIIRKARAKLEGELHPHVMYGCGGDRAFLKKYDIHPADFLRVVWAAKGNDQKIVEYVKSRAS